MTNNYINYIKTIFIIKLKTLLEYPINLYMGIANNISSIFVQIIILSAIAYNFESLVGWSYKEYLFFILIQNLFLRVFGGILFFNRILKMLILRGVLNTFILRPLSPLFQYIINVIPTQAPVIGTTYIIGLIIYIIYYFNSISLINLTLAIILSFLGVILTFLIIRCLESLNFFFKTASTTLISPYLNGSDIFYSYPAHMFQNNIKYLTYIFGNVYFGTYATLIMFNKLEITTYITMTISLLITNLCLLLLLIFLWKQGLKKYEAFG